jgi:hypothetical protein
MKSKTKQKKKKNENILTYKQAPHFTRGRRKALRENAC